ncbi:hypothetical protein C5N14_15445 [Micromonospora sp. MW-13]|uniref:hypothetical protein n=1 Tax=Micromonospora sp. MW-13 TaxID=2094022 RepID=UPI000E4413B6|nr:hypothetical protein [Micromonospora sp. MW-13]RGC67876.1 hypothetical protein C5N14_15445 [Micromonospora sp. MW-13]
MIDFWAGALLHVTRAASPQFARPIFFRLIRVHADWITYDGWIWLDGYQFNAKGDAAARRSIFVQKAGLQVLAPTAVESTPVDRRARRPRRPTPGRVASDS